MSVRTGNDAGLEAASPQVCHIGKPDGRLPLLSATPKFAVVSDHHQIRLKC